MGRPGGSLENDRVLRIDLYFCRLGSFEREQSKVGPSICAVGAQRATRLTCHLSRDGSTLGKAPRLLVPIRTGDFALAIAERPAISVDAPCFGNGLHRFEKRGTLLVAGCYFVNGGYATQWFATIALRPGRARAPLSSVVPARRTLTIAERFRAEPPAVSLRDGIHGE